MSWLAVWAPTALVAGARRADSSFDRFLDVTVTAFATGTFATAGEQRAPLVVDGELPGLDDPDGVIVIEEAVTLLDAQVGTTMRCRTASPERLAEWTSNDGQFATDEALDGPEIVVEVVAVTRFPDDLGDDRFPFITFPEGFARAHRDAVAGALVVATAFGRQASSIGVHQNIGAALGLTRAQRARGTWLVLAPAAITGAVGVRHHHHARPRSHPSPRRQLARLASDADRAGRRGERHPARCDRRSDRRAALVGAALAGHPPPAHPRAAVRVSVMGALAPWATSRDPQRMASLTVKLAPLAAPVATPLPDAAASGALEGR